MTVVLQGNNGLENARRAMVASIERLGHEAGASTVAVSFPKDPEWKEPPGIHETDADWVVE